MFQINAQVAKVAKGITNHNNSNNNNSEMFKRDSIFVRTFLTGAYGRRNS